MGTATGSADRSARHSVDRIALSLRRRLLGGEVSRDKPMPSVRTLACREGISPATAQAAYRQLASEGLVEARPGMGWFAVSQSCRQRRRLALAHLQLSIRPAIQQALASGLSRYLVRLEVLRIVSDE